MRTFSDFSRNTLDLSVVPAVKQISHLPDPRGPVARHRPPGQGGAPAAAPRPRSGADGLIIEVHNDPNRALSDGPQSITPDMFEELVTDLRKIAPVIGRQL